MQKAGLADSHVTDDDVLEDVGVVVVRARHAARVGTCSGVCPLEGKVSVRVTVEAHDERGRRERDTHRAVVGMRRATGCAILHLAWPSTKQSKTSSTLILFDVSK